MLRARVPQLTGALVASVDGLLIARDLPASVEPSGMAAVTATGLSLAHRIAQTAHGGAFHEVVIRGVDGYVVIYAAGPTASLTVLAGPSVNVGRLHLESRPTARAIAAHLTETHSAAPHSAAPHSAASHSADAHSADAHSADAHGTDARSTDSHSTGTRGKSPRGTTTRGTGARGTGTGTRSTSTRGTGTRGTNTNRT
ncbi:hypothetical protein E1285_21210 [Actinomadura sp. 7K507]|nr:hypothetical protein E1285_21210 [Actinomadura sp. 7K507]